MRRSLIAAAGTVVALGFLGASAIANYMFGASLGRSSPEAMLYGSVGVLAVAMNALAPFYISWSLAASRRSAASAIALMWSLCLLYSLTSALGFAAQNREATTLSRNISHDTYEDTRHELLDLEARRKTARSREKARFDERIDDARARLVNARGQNIAPLDAQSGFISSLFFGRVGLLQVRQALVALFAIMVELCATVGLFAALSHVSQKPSPARARNRWSP